MWDNPSIHPSLDKRHYCQRSAYSTNEATPDSDAFSIACLLTNLIHMDGMILADAKNKSHDESKPGVGSLCGFLSSIFFKIPL